MLPCNLRVAWQKQNYTFKGLWDHKYFDQNQLETIQEIEQNRIFGYT